MFPAALLLQRDGEREREIEKNRITQGQDREKDRKTLINTINRIPTWFKILLLLFILHTIQIKITQKNNSNTIRYFSQSNDNT